MKKTIVVAMVFAAFMAGSGCIKDKEKDFAEDQVSFSANTGALETRTDYGEDGSVGGTSVTYVNWVAGDKIIILSSTGSSDIYTVSEDHDGSDSEGISKGNVNPDNSGIAWGTGEQTFYAMYPANVSGSSLTSSAMTCVVPVTWTPASETELGQLPYGYMFAKETTSRTTSVSLTFNAKFTSFTFTLKNPTESDVTLSSLSLSSASKAMNGTYTVNTSNGNIGTLPTAESNKSITVDFTSLTGGGLTVPAGTTANPGTRTFTLVAVPDTFSDLTVSCTSSGGASRTLPLKKNGTYLTFYALKKHNINITLPSFATFEYTFEVINPTDLSDLDGTSNTAIVRSYKSNDDGVTKTPVSWEVEGYYDTAEHAAAGGSTGLLTPGEYDWLTSTIQEASPLVAIQTVNFSYSTTPVTGLTDLEAEINKNIAANVPAEGNPGSSQALAINLANPNNDGATPSTYISESANCYIVNGPGWYKIPLVMGNGVKDNAVDTSSPYHYTGKGGTYAYAGAFYNYSALEITTSTTPILSQPTSVEVMWHDSTVGFSGFDYSSYSSVSNVTKSVYWLKFYVNATGQGNAIIAVKDDDSNVMWSYHIWVTDYTSELDNSTTMSSLLGWITTTGTYSKLPARKVYLRVRQSGNPEQAKPVGVLSIEVPEGPTSSQVISGGYAPYYQWGRKDPIRDRRTTFSPVSNYVCLSYGTQGYKAEQVQIAIRNADKFVQNKFGASAWWGGTSNYSRNVWSARFDSYSGSLSYVNKTIYDPSPAGYSVPYVSSITNDILSKINRKAPQGYRDNSSEGSGVSGGRSAPYTNDGKVTDSEILFLWTAQPYPSSQYNSTALKLNGSSFSSASTDQGDALNILPIKNSRYKN